MKTILELYLWSVDADKTIRFFRYQRDITALMDDPDDVLKEVLAQLDICGDKPIGYAHSTSWRYDAGCVLLTYLVWCPYEIMAGLPARELLLNGVEDALPSDGLTPRPLKINEEQVVAHGLRHLRFLMVEKQDPLIDQVLCSYKAKRVLSLLKPAMAGRI